MRLGASSGSLIGAGLAGAAFALTFFLLVRPLESRYALGLGIASTVFTAVAFAGAWRAYYRPDRIISTDPPTQIVVDGYFSPDPNDTKRQGIYIQVIGPLARDVRVQSFGMKGSDVTFDDISLLTPGDAPRQLVPRFQGHAKSVWEVASFVGLAKVQPVRIARTVMGRAVITAAPLASTGHGRMPLRIKYRDTTGETYVNDEYYLQFIESSSGVPLDTRLVIRRNPAAPVAKSAG